MSRKTVTRGKQIWLKLGTQKIEASSMKPWLDFAEVQRESENKRGRGVGDGKGLGELYIKGGQ